MEHQLICYRRRTLLEAKCQRELLGYMQTYHGMASLPFSVIAPYCTAANIRPIESRKAKLQASSQGRK